MRKIKAVIFDMDGVLVDSEPLADLHIPMFLKKAHGIDAPSDIMKRFRGNSSKTMWTILKQEHGLPHPLEDLISACSDSYLSYILASDLKAIEGVHKLIQKLIKAHIQIAVGSSASFRRIKAILKIIQLERHFSVKISGNDVENGKPAPDIFLCAAQRLQVDPADCVVIEDSTNGVRSAKSAGMKCIGFAGMPHNKQDLSEADWIVKHFKEITLNRLHTI